MFENKTIRDLKRQKYFTVQYKISYVPTKLLVSIMVRNLVVSLFFIYNGLIYFVLFSHLYISKNLRVPSKSITSQTLVVSV